MQHPKEEIDIDTNLCGKNQVPMTMPESPVLGYVEDVPEKLSPHFNVMSFLARPIHKSLSKDIKHIEEVYGGSQRLMSKLTKLGDVDPYEFVQKSKGAEEAGIKRKGQEDATIFGSRHRAKSFKAISDILDHSSGNQKSSSDDDSDEEMFHDETEL